MVSDSVEVTFEGIYETDDGPIPVSDRRIFWLLISESEIEANFEPLGATIEIDGYQVPFPGTFVFNAIPGILINDNSCDY